MRLVGGSEVMVAGEVLLGAHVDIIMFLEIEHRVDRLDRRDTDRSRRQAHILVGIVRRVIFQMALV